MHAPAPRRRMRLLRALPLLSALPLLLLPLAAPVGASDPCGTATPGPTVLFLHLSSYKRECAGVVVDHALFPCPPEEWGHDLRYAGVGGHTYCETRVFVWHGWVTAGLP